MPKEKLFDEAEVLEKATAVFWHNGYNGTSMDDLTKATGLSRSSIYNTFKDKHGLFIRSLQFYQADQQKQLMAVLDKIESPVQKIRTAFKYMVEMILADKSRNGCLMVNTTTELSNINPEVGEMVLANTEGMEALFLRWVKEAQQLGEVSVNFSPQAIARHLFNTYSGLRVRGQAKADKKILDDIVKVALSVLL